MATFLRVTQGTLVHHVNIDAVGHLETLPNGSTMIHFIGGKTLHVDATAEQISQHAKNMS